MDTTTVFGTVNPRSSRGEGIKHMKKIFLAIFLIGLSFPLISLADGNFRVTDKTAGGTTDFHYEGIVPCGRCVEMMPNGAMARIQVSDIHDKPTCEKNGYSWTAPSCYMCPASKRYIPCTPCHLFVMIDGIIDFVLLKMVPLIATLILMIGGIALYTAGSSPERFKQAKDILTSVIIGLVIIYTSWIIVSTVLSAVGIASWVGFGSGWFQINCKITM